MITIIESPYAYGSPDELLLHHAYLRLVLRDSYLRGENPFASHAIYPIFLHEDIPRERDHGIMLGHELWEMADLVALYADLGESSGMAMARTKARMVGMRTETRTLFDRHPDLRKIAGLLQESLGRPREVDR